MKRLLLPALRGHIGDWVFYSCIMPLAEVGKRVSYAKEVHRNKRLSDMIQRVLKERRAGEIADYLASQDQRFFNSLVVAVYDEDPTWYPVSQLEGRHRDIDVEDVVDRIESLGILELSPSLEMFAVDSQHRLAGIKLLVEQNRAAKTDQLPVVLVGHKKTLEGLERTRRLFTTLNKNAKNVSKGETIALDEDDTAAITVRRLVEKSPYFSGTRIAYQPTNNLPKTNRTSLTTIGNLYDLTWTILSKIQRPSGGTPAKELRPGDDVLDECEQIVVEFFNALGERFPPIASFLSTKKHAVVVARHRHTGGGHVLFRPVGLSIFAELVAELRKKKKMGRDAALDLVARLPIELTEKPYAGILWDPGREAMAVKGKVIARDLLRLALDLPAKEDTVHKKLAAWLGASVSDVNLPDWIPSLATPASG